MTMTLHHRPATRALYAGLALTVIALIVPFVDHATGNVLADHIQAGYSSYRQARVDAAATLYLIILSVVGALGVLCWLATIWAVKAGKGWARWFASVMFALGTSVALTALLTKDTSGDVGLAPLLGWVGILPCVAGVVAVTLLWKRSR
jgi:cytochrome bd-type quinol oxidase subunit 2